MVVLQEQQQQVENDDDDEERIDRSNITTRTTTNTTASTATKNDDDYEYIILLLPQCFVGFIDAISFMIVTPSFLFYIYSVGGTKESYGVLLSVFSLSSFLFKPILGYWCDTLHCQFRIPYLSSLLIAAIGGLFYFLASTFSPTTTSTTQYYALFFIFVGRFMGGIGAANSTLGFTYIASVVSPDRITQATALLSMVSILGMAIAPGFNIVLAQIHGNIWHVEITPLNCIGLVLFIMNLLSFLVMFLFLKEPPPRTNVNHDNDDNNGENSSNKKQQTPNRDWQFWSSTLSVDTIVPVLCILSMNANFQLLETGLSPASYHALQFTQVEISTIFGMNAVWIFIMLLLSFNLSSHGVSDNVLLIIGLIASIVGYTLIYLLWSMHTSITLFVLPILIASISFPFMGAPSRSIFTKVIDNKVLLRNHQGTMQAIMSMAASVAGFTAPSLIASFVLRSPEQVEASKDLREFSPYALFAPISSILAMIGVLYMNYCIVPSRPTPIDTTTATTSRPSENDNTVVVANEYTNLLPETSSPPPSDMSYNELRRTRRHSGFESILGISNLSHRIDT